VCHENASRKSVTKLPQKSMLREFAKASEAEIGIRVRRRYLTSFARLRFENEPGLRELDAAEGRRNRLSRWIRRSKSANLPWSWARRQTAYARFYRHEEIMISTLFASSKFVTNRNHFQVIAETGPTGQLYTTTAWQMAATSSVQKTKSNWTFRNLQCSFMPKSQLPEWHGIQP